MATDSNVPLNERQAALCRATNIGTEGMSVLSENEGVLRLIHHPTRNFLWIDKAEAQRRKEKEMKLW